MQHLFVYGSLLRSRKGKIHPLLSEAFSFVSAAEYRGILYDLGPYPAVIASDSPLDAVAGELYRTEKMEALRPLDRYEGPQYERVDVRVTTPTGETRRAWIYLFVGPLKQGVRIASGDYRDRQHRGRKP